MVLAWDTRVCVELLLDGTVHEPYGNYSAVHCLNTLQYMYGFSTCILLGMQLTSSIFYIL